MFGCPFGWSSQSGLKYRPVSGENYMTKGFCPVYQPRLLRRSGSICLMQGESFLNTSKDVAKGCCLFCFLSVCLSVCVCVGVLGEGGWGGVVGVGVGAGGGGVGG